MFCSKCGTENADGAKFCKGCGAELAVAPKQETDVKKDETNVKETETTKTVEKAAEKATQKTSASSSKKGISPKLIGIAAVIVAALVVFLMITSKPTIDLNKYVTVEINGYEGCGEATAVIDWSAISKKYGKKLKYTKEAKELLGDSVNSMSPMDSLQCGVTVVFNENGTYSNGSKATYTWQIAENLEKSLNCKLKYKDGSKKASGLTDIAKFDPFQNLTVTFQGESPNGYLRLEYTGDDISEAWFGCDTGDHLQNGQVITIYLTKKDMDLYAKKFGKVPAVTSKEYEVSGLNEMICSMDALTEDHMKMFYGEAEDSIKSYYSIQFGHGMRTVNNIERVGYVFTAPDVANGSTGRNDLTIIYKITYDEDGTTYYTFWPQSVMNVVKNGEGGITYDESAWGTKTSANDYITEDPDASIPFQLYADIVDKVKDSKSNEDSKFVIETSDNIKGYVGYKAITSLAELNETSKQEIYDLASEYAEEYVAEAYGCGVNGSEIAGDAIFYSKQDGVEAPTDYVGRYTSSFNKYYVVVAVKVSGLDDGYDTIYCPIVFDGVVQLADGTNDLCIFWGIEGGALTGKYFSVHGFVNSDEMYDWVVNSNKSMYEYEVSEELKQFYH